MKRFRKFIICSNESRNKTRGQPERV